MKPDLLARDKGCCFQKLLIPDICEARKGVRRGAFAQSLHGVSPNPSGMPACVFSLPCVCSRPSWWELHGNVSRDVSQENPMLTRRQVWASFTWFICRVMRLGFIFVSSIQPRMLIMRSWSMLCEQRVGHIVSQTIAKTGSSGQSMLTLWACVIFLLFQLAQSQLKV